MKNLKIHLIIAAIASLVAVLLIIYFFVIPSPRERAVADFEEAKELLRQGRVFEAEAKLRSIIAVDSTNPDYFTAMAKVMEMQGDYETAAASYIQVSELKTETADPVFKAGMMKLKAGKTESAKELFRKAMEREPKNIPVLYQLGFLYLLSRELDKAQDIYQKIVDLSDEEPEAFRNLGFIYSEKEQLELAEQMYRKSIELRPNAGIYNDLGNLLVIMERPEVAREAFQNALELEPGHEDALRNLEQLNTYNPPSPEGAEGEMPKPADGGTAAPTP